MFDVNTPVGFRQMGRPLVQVQSVPAVKERVQAGPRLIAQQKWLALRSVNLGKGPPPPMLVVN